MLTYKICTPKEVSRAIHSGKFFCEIIDSAMGPFVLEFGDISTHKKFETEEPIVAHLFCEKPMDKVAMSFLHDCGVASKKRKSMAAYRVFEADILA